MIITFCRTLCINTLSAAPFVEIHVRASRPQISRQRVQDKVTLDQRVQDKVTLGPRVLDEVSLCQRVADNVTLDRRVQDKVV